VLGDLTGAVVLHYAEDRCVASESRRIFSKLFLTGVDHCRLVAIGKHQDSNWVPMSCKLTTVVIEIIEAMKAYPARSRHFDRDRIAARPGA
jgi:hypothetical protein